MPLRAEVAFRGPFAFFGHSLGALVAYEVARVLRATGRRQPDRLFASACPAPHLVLSDAPIHQLPDEQLAALIDQEYGSLPADISDDPALLQMVLPAHRADFELVETYEYRAGRASGPPSHRDRGDRGRADRTGAGRLAHAHCRRWEIELLPGGHFYLREQQDRLLEIVRDRLQPTDGTDG